MKKNTFIWMIALLFVGLTQAQNLKTVPYNSEVRQLNDGWHQFSLQDATLDVEIQGGHYVKGNIVWLDGSTYSGSLSGALISGRGSYTWPDGSKYEGTFRKNNRHGKGSMIAADGSKWSGKWKHNAKNGKGKFFDIQGVVAQKGIWENDVYMGEKKAKKK